MGKKSIGQIVLGSVLTVAGIMTGQGWLVGIGVSMAAGGVVSALQTPEERQKNLHDNPASPNADIAVVYGETVVGVRYADMRRNVDNTQIMLAVGVVCIASEAGGGIEDITAIYFDNETAVTNPVTDGSLSTTGVASRWGDLSYSVHLGTDAQAVDATLASLYATAWPSTSKGAGIAYIVLRPEYNEDIYPHGWPNVTVKVKGQKVFDPRDDSTAWSANPALCVRDYLTSEKYGCAVPTSEIDDDSFEAAANYCDEAVNTTAYSGVRFTCNGAVDTTQSRAQNLAELLTSCRGRLVYEGGLFRLLINQPEAVETFALTEDNIVGDWEFLRVGDVPNSVTASWVDPLQRYQAREITWPEAGQANGFLTADNDLLSPISIALPYTQSAYIAQQIGMVTLREQREDVLVAVTAKQEALKLQVGNVVNVTHSTPGFTAKAFRVETLGILPDATVRLTLREYDEDAYTLDTQNTVATVPGTDLLPFPQPELLEFDVIERSALGVTFGWQYSRTADVVLVFRRLVALDERFTAFGSGDLYEILQDGETAYFIPYPEPNTEWRYGFQARGAAPDYVTGSLIPVAVGPSPGMVPAFEKDDTETAGKGVAWWKVVLRDVAVASYEVQTQIGNDPPDDVTTPLRDQGDASTVKGGTLGVGEYEHEVSLATNKLSRMWVWAVLETGERTQVGRWIFDTNNVANMVSVTVSGTKVLAIADTETKSIRLHRTDGGTWEQWVDGSSFEFDVSVADPDANAGIGASETWAIEVCAYAEPVAEVDGSTQFDCVDKVINGGSATPPTWVTAYGAAPLTFFPDAGSDEVLLTLKASSAPVGHDVHVWRRERRSGSDWTDPADITAELDPVPSAPPTSDTNYTDAHETYTRGTNFLAEYDYTAEIWDGSEVVVATNTFRVTYYTDDAPHA